jgi:Rrf2 family transcriptional regulator, iron-sulfur cluster assembly transcription factor
MLFSRSAEYAIRAMTLLASQEPGRLMGAREISEIEKIPMPFLWKILRMLTLRKLVRSFKGVRGGYELARAAEEVSLNDVFLATDGGDFREECVLGLPACDNQNPCPLHEKWKQIREDMSQMLDHTSLANLAQVTRKRKNRRHK